MKQPEQGERSNREISYFQKSQSAFLSGIDANKSLPEIVREQLKDIVKKQFQIMWQIIGTTELIFLRNQQS